MSDKIKVTIEEKHELGVTFWRVDCEKMCYPQDFKTRDEVRDFITKYLYNYELVEVA